MDSGLVPKHGAILMSNCRTRQECFDRKLLGLPFQYANFVKAIKGGMILFLYEYENKILHGVFEATSDGAMDIVPHAYRSSGKKFPAQVKFRVICNCDPLPETKFRDAIKENYYTTHHFNFGLSKQQVYQLLYLFDSMTVRVQKSLMKKRKKRQFRSTCKLNPSADSEILGAESSGSMIDSEGSKSVAMPRALRSELVALHNKTERRDVSSCSAYVGLEDYIPLSSSESPVILADPSYEHLKVKGLCSDILDERASVFSRLKMAPKVVEEEQSEREMRKSVHNIRERMSVFSRLKMAPKVVEEEQSEREMRKSVHNIMERLLQKQEIWDKNTKRKLSSSSKNESSDVKPIVCESHLKEPIPSEGSSAGKENCGNLEVSIRSDAADNVKFTSSQKKDPVASHSCTFITLAKPLTTFKRRRHSVSPSAKYAPGTINESTVIIFDNPSHREPEEQQPDAIQPSFCENGIYPILKSKVMMSKGND